METVAIPVIEDPGRGLRVAAYGIWALVGYILWREVASEPASIWLPAALSWGLFFVGMHAAWTDYRIHAQQGMIGLLLMAVCIAALGWVQNETFHVVLLVVLAGIVPYILSIRRALLFVLSVYAVSMVVVYWRWHDQTSLLEGIINLSYLTFAAFAVFASLAVQRETAAREELASVNQQLRATQQLLTDNAIQDERLRISRDLHDTLGHHLTALNLQLEIARKLSDGKTLDHVEQAQAIAKLLLSDVRDVVADMRAVPSLDIESALRQLVESARAKVSLTVDLDVNLNNPRLVETLFRLTQEIVTNSNRHSTSNHLNIVLSGSDGHWLLTANDGGTQPVVIQEGAGIRGMRERVAQLGGEFNLHTERGIAYAIKLPQSHD